MDQPTENKIFSFEKEVVNGELLFWYPAVTNEWIKLIKNHYVSLLESDKFDQSLWVKELLNIVLIEKDRDK